MSRTRNIQSIIGYGLPYVFVENIKLTKGSMRRDDRNFYEDTRPSFIKNKFGRNEKQKKPSYKIKTTILMRLLLRLLIYPYLNFLQIGAGLEKNQPKT